MILIFLRPLVFKELRFIWWVFKREHRIALLHIYLIHFPGQIIVSRTILAMQNERIGRELLVNHSFQDHNYLQCKVSQLLERCSQTVVCGTIPAKQSP